MRIIRPQQLVVIKGAYQLGRECRLGISVVAGCYLSRTAHFLGEAQIWEAWKRAPLSVPILDAAEPKPFAEYLMAGYAGVGHPVKSLDVSAEIGELSRYWRVEGEAKRGGIDVAPFLTVPLDHPAAWGGTPSGENPLGRGESDARQPLLMLRSGQGAVQARAPLAAPSPVPQTFPLRKTHLDRVAGQMADKRYLDTVFPGLPASIDRRYFQMAPPAQWLPNAEWPDEVPFELQGVGAQETPIQGTLPAVRGRAFIRRYGSDEIEAIALQRKTLWFLPNSDAALMIFTGSVPLKQLFDESIESLMVALDRCDSPRTFEHFQHVHYKRSDDDASPFEFLLDTDLMPTGMGLNLVESASDHPSSLRYSASPTSTAAAEAFYQRIRDLIAAHHQETVESAEQHDLPDIPNDNSNENENDWLNHEVTVIEDKCFKNVTNCGYLEGKSFHRCRFMQCDLSRSTIEKSTFDKCIFDDVDLTHATLKGVRMTHCSLQDAVMMETHLNEVILDNVTFETLKGARVNVVGSELKDCAFARGAMIASRFDGSTLSNGMFNQTRLDGTQFVQSRLEACVFNRCVAEAVVGLDTLLIKNSVLGGLWHHARFERCQIESLTAGMNVALEHAVVSDCTLTKVGFKQANLRECQLLYSAFTESNFDQADLTASSVTACDMAGARFKDSTLACSRWLGTSLQQGMLYNADVSDATFEQCNLASANLAMIKQSKDTRFSECLLEHVCWWPRSNMQEVSV